MSGWKLQCVLAAGAGLAVSAVAQAQYTIVNNVPGSWTEISSTGTVINPNNQDDGTGAFTSSVTNALVINPSLFVCTNGFISNLASFTTFTNQPLPYALSGLTLGLFPNWDDLFDDTPGTILHQAVTESGVSVDVVEFHQVRTYANNGGSGRGSFEVKIFGAGGPALVQYLYQGMAWDWNGNSSTVGVQWSATDAYAVPGLNGNFTDSGTGPLADNTVFSVIPPTTPGACCLPDGSCSSVSMASCASQNGAFQGFGVACGSVACTPPGSCCLPNLSCALLTAAQCTSQGGTFHGTGSTCAGTNCPTPGACCLPNLSCTQTNGPSCTSQGGSYRGDNTSCASANCPTPGACCAVDGTCTQTNGPACTSSGGTYHGDGTACGTANCPGPTAGPDVIVGEVWDITNHGAVGSITGFSIGTDSCNLGDIGVTWVSSNNQHPVITGNMYRLKTVSGAAHFEQIGLSWFKNGFSATNSSFCGTCHTSDGTHLGPGGCSDIYGSGLNGSQSIMGPRSVVNATTGVYPYPYTLGWQTTGDAIYKHIQCFTTDVDVAQNTGALYFAEANYTVPDDAQFSHNGANATNGLNNYSYRLINASTLSSGAPGFSALTHMQEPAIDAWKAQDSSVTQVNADYIDSSVGPNIVARFIVAAKATSLGGGIFHYEYAIFNLNSDRSGGSFSVPIPAGAQITNVGFHAPFYHSGEIYDNTAWDSAVAGGAVTWTPHPFSPVANANALRWGTTYNFRFDANIAPGTGNATLGLFKAGSPSSVAVVGVPVPGQTCYANCDGSTSTPILNVSDFTCFLQKFSLGDPYANCDNSTSPPTLNVADFTCFLQKFAQGCP